MHGGKLRDRNASPRTAARPKADYGIESFGAIKAFLIVGGMATLAGILCPTFSVAGFQMYLLGPTLLAIGVLSLTGGGLMLAYALRGKYIVRELMLSSVEWKGDEAVLDIGTGHGLLVIGAAKRLKSGTATGINPCQTEDLPDNPTEKALRNVSIEGVEDRVDIRNDDPRSISFLDNSFDVVLSLFFIHKAGTKRDRDLICQEIARLLRPGGSAVIVDNANITEYAKALAKAGLAVERPRSIFHRAYMPMGFLLARKA